MAEGLARHAAARQSVVARNIANVNTPGYRQRDIASFAEVYRPAEADAPMRRTRPGHLAAADGLTLPRQQVVAEARAAPNGNSVSLETEIVKSAELRQQHEMALSIYRSALSVLRTSLGRQ